MKLIYKTENGTDKIIETNYIEIEGIFNAKCRDEDPNKRKWIFTE